MITEKFVKSVVPFILLLIAPLADSGVQALQTPRTALQELAAPLPRDPAVRTGTLSNGLRYYVRQNARPEKRAELRLVVNVGSILEDDDQRGLAHFVEHMAFNGTRNFSKSAIVDFLELSGMRFGADVNASTSFDETIYMLQLPTDSAAILATGLQILEEWAHLVTFDSAEVEKERGVVIEEWRAGRGAAARIRDRQLPVLLHNSLYADRLPIGDERSLSTFTHAALKRFYSDWYRPDLMAVVAVGDFDLDEMERSIRERFSQIAAPQAPRPRPVPPVPAHDSTLIASVTDPEETSTSLSVFFKSEARRGDTHAHYRRQLTEALFDQMLNARLYEMTVRPNAPFLYAYAGHSGLVRSADAYTLGVGTEDGGLASGLHALLLEAERVARFGFTETELERARANMLRSMEQAFAELSTTNSAVFANEYVRAFLQDEPFPGVAYEFELYRRYLPTVSVEELNALGRQLFPEANRVILLSGPERSAIPLPQSSELLQVLRSASSAELQPYTDDVSDDPLIAELPPPGQVTSSNAIGELGITEWTLSNGVRVVLKPTDFKADEIVVSAFSPGGTSLASDADAFVMENAGIAIEVGGVGTLDQVAMEKRLAGKAAGASPYLGRLEEGMTAFASPKDVDTMFELIHLYFTAPRRDSGAFEAFRQQVSAMLQHSSADPGRAFSDTLTRVLSDYHPRVRLVSASMLDSLDLDRSIAFYKDRFADAGDFTFVIVGSFNTDSIRPLVERYLGSLPSTGRQERWRDNGVRPPAGVVKRDVHRGLEAQSQTTLVFTGPTEYTRANRFALATLSEVLSIRLRESLREDLGGTYGVGAGGSATRDPWESYSFRISFGSAPERIDSLVNVVFFEIASLQQNGARESELEKVRETLRRSYETNLRENGYWLNQLAAYYRLGEDPRQILTYPEVLATLSSDLVRDAARRYLRTDNYVQVTLRPERGGGER